MNPFSIRLAGNIHHGVITHEIKPEHGDDIISQVTWKANSVVARFSNDYMIHLSGPQGLTNHTLFVWNQNPPFNSSWINLGNIDLYKMELMAISTTNQQLNYIFLKPENPEESIIVYDIPQATSSSFNAKGKVMALTPDEKYLVILEHSDFGSGTNESYMSLELIAIPSVNRDVHSLGYSICKRVIYEFPMKNNMDDTCISPIKHLIVIPHPQHYVFGTLCRIDHFDTFFIRFNVIFSDERGPEITTTKYKLDLEEYSEGHPYISAVSPDGQLFAVRQSSSSEDPFLFFPVYTPNQHTHNQLIKPIMELNLMEVQNELQWCPINARYLAVHCWSYVHKRTILKIFDLVTSEVVAALDSSSHTNLGPVIRAFCWSPCGTQLAIASEYKIFIWDVGHLFIPTVHELIERDLRGIKPPSMVSGRIIRDGHHEEHSDQQDEIVDEIASRFNNLLQRLPISSTPPS